VYCVCFEVQTGKHLLGLNLSAVMAVISPRSNGWPQENQPGCIKKNILRDLFVP
jgi:hypothetical protein